MVSVVAALEDEVRPLRWEEYDQLVELGAFEGEKLELLFGRIVQMAPQGEEHATSMEVLNERLVLALAGRAVVRCRSPFIAPDESEPEPDLLVAPRRPWRAGHPDRAHLVIEIAASSQDKDRGAKAVLYALAGVPEYWIVDVKNRRVERYRRPLEGRYAESSLHEPDESLPIGAFPDVVIPLREILPGS